MLAGLCFIVVQVQYWLCLVSDAGWMVLDLQYKFSTGLCLVSDDGRIVLDCSTSLVLAVPGFRCWLD